MHIKEQQARAAVETLVEKYGVAHVTNALSQTIRNLPDTDPRKRYHDGFSVLLDDAAAIEGVEHEIDDCIQLKQFIERLAA